MLLVGTIIHIGKLFESYDGIILNNRFMCIIGIEQNNILMLPMLSFHSTEHKEKKLSYETNFEYSMNHGNTRNGYLRCNQLYCLSMDDFNKFPAEIKVKHKMDSNHFLTLIKHIGKLKQENKLNLIKKDMIFKNQISLSDEKLIDDEENEL